MHAATDRLEFAPPATPGRPRALILAVLVHGLLLVALSLGVQWKRDAQVISADAELWSAVPREAAPKLLEPPLELPPPEPPAPTKAVPPAPDPTPVVTAPAPKLPEFDIALEQEKLRLKKQHERELAKQEALRLEKIAEQKHLQDKLKQDKLKHDKLKADKLKADKLKQEQFQAEKLKQEQADKAQKAALDKKQAAVEAKQLEAQRVKNLQRMTGMAGASGGPNAGGTALKSSGPSASYAGRIRARVKPNIVFTEEPQGNPVAEVEVRTSPDGTIISHKISKSSGLKSWDDAVLKALDRTQVLPRDTDGTVPSALLLVFRPKD